MVKLGAMKVFDLLSRPTKQRVPLEPIAALGLTASQIGACFLVKTPLLKQLRFLKKFGEKFRATTEGIVGLRGIIWVALVLFTQHRRRRVL